MKNKSKDLIEQKAMLLAACKMTKRQIEDELYDLIRSIKANEPNEFRAIGNNENTQEKCEHPIELIRQNLITKVCTCDKCGKDL